MRVMAERYKLIFESMGWRSHLEVLQMDAFIKFLENDRSSTPRKCH